MQTLGEAVTIFGRSVVNPSFWTGLLMVYLFCHTGFRIHSCEGDELDPPVVARSYTTRLRYGIAEGTYIGGYFMMYILLVCIGSFPFLQGLFKALVGTVEVVGEERIGSPAWAALAATSLLPSVPAMKELDQALRDFLHDFASVPVKAHRLAEDLLRAVHEEAGGGNANPRSLAPRREEFLRLWHIAKSLVESGNPRARRQYRAFFKTLPDFLETLQSRRQSIEAGIGNRDEATSLELAEYEATLRRMSRYVSCAMLSAEAGEYEARKRLHREMGMSGVRVVGWQFRIEQILIAIVLVSLAMVAGGLAAMAVYEHLVGSDLKKVADWVPVFAKWSLYTAPMFTLPLIFASGVKLYMVDRELYQRDPMQWEDKFTAYLVTFCGSFFLGAFPVMVGVSLHMALNPKATWRPDVGRYLLLGMLPAFFCVVFLLRSSAKRALVSPGVPGAAAWNSLVDFAVHGGVVGAAGYLLSLYVFPGDEKMQWMALVIPTCIAGAMGWIQCAISRRYLTGDRGGEGKGSEAPAPPGAGPSVLSG